MHIAEKTTFLHKGKIMTSILSSVSSQITNNIFSKIDTSNQGYIGKSEFTDAMEKSNSNDQTTDAQALFDSIDADSDGKITKSELSTKIESLLSQLDSSMQGTGRGHGMGRPSGMGDEAGITKEQATELASSTDNKKPSSIMSEISENFDEIDTDKDGKVSREEGKAFHEANQAQTSTSGTSQVEELKLRMAQLIEAYGLGTSEESSSIFANA